MTQSTHYPTTHLERTRWILERRGYKNALDPNVPYAYLWEEECDENGEQISTATLFLTNKECPYRCLMCDLVAKYVRLSCSRWDDSEANRLCP